MPNENIFTLCSDDDIAEVMPFKKENITRRYKDVDSKRLLYNGMQVITFMEMNNITEADLKLALSVLIKVDSDIPRSLKKIESKVSK